MERERAADLPAAGFDYAAFRRACEAKDVAAWLPFYADDAEWVEYRQSDPPRSPHRLTGRTAIGEFLTMVAHADVVLELGAEVVGTARAAFRVTVTRGDGRRIIEHVILELRDGRIARQVEVEAWD
jgi:ketosteroid isomerase-like protein